MPHWMPQPPQLLELEVMLVSQPFIEFMSQSANPMLQVYVHEAFTHDAVAFGTCGHA